MTQYRKLNIKLSDSQLKEIEISNKNATDVTLRLPSNMISTYKTYFPHELLLTDRQVYSR